LKGVREGPYSEDDFKSNTLEPTADDSSAWAQMYYFFKHNRETFLEHYPQRSNAETAYSAKY